MLKRLVKVFLFIFAALFGGSLPAFSQDTCDLRFDVYEFRDNGDSENFPVKDYEVRLVEEETKKPIKTGKAGGELVIKNIKAGRYIANFSKDGFQNTEIKFSLDCGLADAKGTASKIVFLWKGDSKKTFKAYLDLPAESTGSFGVKKPDSKSDILNHGALTLAKPVYPAAARYVKASGAVDVQVLINELGSVVSANAVSGHPLLRPAAVEAAMKSKFRMTLLSGIPVKVNGIIVYNFVP